MDIFHSRKLPFEDAIHHSHREFSALIDSSLKYDSNGTRSILTLCDFDGARLHIKFSFVFARRKQKIGVNGLANQHA